MTPAVQGGDHSGHPFVRRLAQAANHHGGGSHEEVEDKQANGREGDCGAGGRQDFEGNHGQAA